MFHFIKPVVITVSNTGVLWNAWKYVSSKWIRRKGNTKGYVEHSLREK